MMQVALPKALLDEKNSGSWKFDGWRAIANSNAPESVKTACEEHNKRIIEEVGTDDDE